MLIFCVDNEDSVALAVENIGHLLLFLHCLFFSPDGLLLLEEPLQLSPLQDEEDAKADADVVQMLNFSHAEGNVPQDAEEDNDEEDPGYLTEEYVAVGRREKDHIK